MCSYIVHDVNVKSFTFRQEFGGEKHVPQIFALAGVVLLYIPISGIAAKIVQCLSERNLKSLTLIIMFPHWTVRLFFTLKNVIDIWQIFLNSLSC